MIRIVTPGWQFTRLSEAEIHAALKDPNPGNHIALEVARLAEAYTEHLLIQAGQSGVLADGFLQVPLQTEIEAVAMRLATGAIQQSFDAAPHTHPLAA
jgi:hypothetical protein